MYDSGADYEESGEEVVQYQEEDDIEEPFEQFKLHEQEFSGFVGNLGSDFLKQRLGAAGEETEGAGADFASGHFLGSSGVSPKSNDLGDILSCLAGQIVEGSESEPEHQRAATSGVEGFAGNLIGGLLSNVTKKGGGGGGGGGGDFGTMATDLLSGLLGGGGSGAQGGIDYGSLIGRLLGGGRGGKSTGGDVPLVPGGEAPAGRGTAKGLIDDILGGKGIGHAIGGLISGSGGNANRGTAGGDAGGGNLAMNQLKGGLIDAFSNLVAAGAKRFFGIDPATGKILGAVAGNMIFQMGGKDNSLGNVGKTILDNIISGKFKRKVEPFVPAEPGVPKEPYRPSRPVPSLPEPTSETDFHRLREQCLKEQTLFEDPDFPANSSSLFFSSSRQRLDYRIEWLRPAEICKDPQLFIEGHTRFDVVQGKLGDCWLLAATACLTLRDELFYRVCPPDQSFTDNYAGIFHFQFWHYGKWVDVVVDDRLPCSDGELLYMHSAENREFWSALLEKAYAKLFGSYEALKGGTTSEALEDFTGGLTEFIDLQAAPHNLMQMMFTAFERGSLLACSIEADPRIFEARLPNGLVKGHAYSITGMKVINGPRGKVPLIRVRNPWGNSQEWNGAWSDDSPEWRSIPEHEKEAVGLKFAHDGESWMCYDDFVRCFEKLEFCHLGPEVMDEIEEMTGSSLPGASWTSATAEGAWQKYRTAGGCRNFLKTFCTNPQILFNMENPDTGDKDGLCTVVVGLLQKNRRELRSQGLEMLPIGFAIYEGQQSDRLTTNYFASTKAIARSPVFINLREVCGRFRLAPGQYVVVPSTYDPNDEGEFMLRLFAQSETSLSCEVL